MADDNPFAEWKKKTPTEPVAGVAVSAPVPAADENPFAEFAIRRPDDQSLPPASPPQAARPAMPEASTPEAPVSVPADIAKSAGIGLVKGVVSLPGIPGSIESLARHGINWMRPGTVSEDTVLPTPGSIQNHIEDYTGKFYEPKTTAGEYAQTLGEFAPMAALPVAGATSIAGRAAARALNVAAPAITSETAGQITKGTAAEPWARLIGGLAGPSSVSALLRLRSPVAPLQADATLADHVANLRNAGVTDLDAGQVTGSEWLKRRNMAADKTAFGPGDAQTVRAQEQFNNAVGRSFGEDVDRITPDVIDQAHTRIGGVFDRHAQAIGTMPPDPVLAQGVQHAVSDYVSHTNPSSRLPVIDNYQADIAQYAAHGMTGDQLATLRTNMNNSRARLMRTDPNAAHTIGDMMGHLDDAVMRHAGPQSAQELQQARTQYRNLMSTQKVVDSSTPQATLGHVSPAKLFNATKAKISANTAARGRDPLHELARSGQAVMNKVNSSGTAENTVAHKFFQDIPAWAALEAGGLAMGAPGLATLAAVGKSVVPGIAARAWKSGPAQRWLGNDAALPALRTYQANRPSLRSLGAFTGNAIGSQAHVGISGGMGPRYDENGNLKVPEGAFQ